MCRKFLEMDYARRYANHKDGKYNDDGHQTSRT